MRRDDIRQAISDLDRQRTRNLVEFELRESEIRRLLDMIQPELGARECV